MHTQRHKLYKGKLFKASGEEVGEVLYKLKPQSRHIPSPQDRNEGITILFAEGCLYDLNKEPLKLNGEPEQGKFRNPYQLVLEDGKRILIHIARVKQGGSMQAIFYSGRRPPSWPEGR